MNPVKITVLMPVYNAAGYIGEAIQSVLKQTLPDFELLIVNDGSTDESVSIIKQFKDKRIRILELPRVGIATALNAGLQEAEGIYIARFDADDICIPHRLEKQAAFLDMHPEYVITGSDAEYISEAGEHLFDHLSIAYTHEEIMEQLYVYCPFIHSSVMYRKDAALKAGGYPPDAHNFEDYLFWIHLSKFGSFNNLPEQLIKVRLNPASATIDEKWRGRRFRKLKKNIIYRGYVRKDEGEELLSIITRQSNKKLKNGAYYSLCGKKFLVNNYQPAKARTQLTQAMSYYPLRLENYALYILSFFPRSFINWLHSKSPNRI